MKYYFIYLCHFLLLYILETFFISHFSSSALNLFSSLSAVIQSPVSVYGALYHGQHVTQWNAATRDRCMSQLPAVLFEQWRYIIILTSSSHTDSPNFHSNSWCLSHTHTECKISSLHCHTTQLLVGLCSGKILVLDPLSYSLLSILTCHRGPVQSFLTLPSFLSDSSSLSTPYHWSSSSSATITKKKSSAVVNHFLIDPALDQCHSLDLSQILEIPVPSLPQLPYSQYLESSILSNSQSSSSGGSSGRSRHVARLLSLGSGFKSYYDGPESIPHGVRIHVSMGSSYLHQWTYFLIILNSIIF